MLSIVWTGDQVSALCRWIIEAVKCRPRRGLGTKPSKKRPRESRGHKARAHLVLRLEMGDAERLLPGSCSDQVGSPRQGTHEHQVS